MATKKKATVGKENSKPKKPVAAAPALSNSAIANKAMLVRVTVHWWNPHTSDKEVGEETAKRYGADASMGRYRKLLIPREAIAKLQSIKGDLRREHYFLTLPWDNEGYRILSSSAYFDYKKKMAELEAKFNAAVAEFVQEYPAHVKNASIKHGKMHKPEEYPTVQEIQTKYGVEFNVRGIPSGKDFRCDVGDDEVKRIREEIEEQAAATIKAAMKEPWERLQEVISHMADKLKSFSVDKDGKRKNSFRDSLVTNITELLDVIPVLNITGDQALTDFAVKVRAELTEHSAEVLRDDDKVRASVAEKADGILAMMEGYLA